MGGWGLLVGKTRQQFLRRPPPPDSAESGVDRPALNLPIARVDERAGLVGFHDSAKNEALILYKWVNLESYSAASHVGFPHPIKMSPFCHLVRFESEEDGSSYFADLGPDADGPPLPGTKLTCVRTIEGLAQQSGQVTRTLHHVSLAVLWHAEILFFE